MDAVGAWSRCNRCDRWGHFARDCPSKGKEKWDFGKGGGKGNHNGNSNFKGGYKGDGKNNQHKGDGKGGKGQKGGGKGYQGTCWRCGMVGHKANECTKQIQEVEGVNEEVVEEVHVGGLWMIGTVQAEWKTHGDEEGDDRTDTSVDVLPQPVRRIGRRCEGRGWSIRRKD